VGFISTSAVAEYTGNRSLTISADETQEVHVTQGPYGGISVDKEQGCFLQKRFRKATVATWHFHGKFKVNGFSFPLNGPAPWTCVPVELRHYYLSNEASPTFSLAVDSGGDAPIYFKDWYLFDDAYSDTNAWMTWSKNDVDKGIEAALTPPYHVPSTYGEGHHVEPHVISLYYTSILPITLTLTLVIHGLGPRIARRTLQKHPIRGLRGLVIGSQLPWLESVLLAHGATTIVTGEYSIIDSKDTRIQYKHIRELMVAPQLFDFIFSYSSLEHDGLGRYGDPWHPDADMEMLARIHDKWLKPGGKLYLAVPIGADILDWNAHRVYGRKRWRRIFEEAY